MTRTDSFWSTLYVLGSDASGIDADDSGSSDPGASCEDPYSAVKGRPVTGVPVGDRVRATIAYEGALIRLSNGDHVFVDVGDPIPEGAVLPSGETIWEPEEREEQPAAPAEAMHPEEDVDRTRHASEEARRSRAPISRRGPGSETAPVPVPPPAVGSVSVGAVVPIPLVPPAPIAPPVAPSVPAPPAPAGVVWPQGGDPRVEGVPLRDGDMIEAQINGRWVGGHARVVVRQDLPGARPGLPFRQIQLIAGGLGLPPGFQPVAAPGITRGTAVPPGSPVRIVTKQNVHGIATSFITGESSFLPKNPGIGRYPVHMRIWDPHPGRWVRGALLFAFEGCVRFISDEEIREGVHPQSLPPVRDMSWAVSVVDSAPLPWDTIYAMVLGTGDASGAPAGHDDDPAGRFDAVIRRLRGHGVPEAEITEIVRSMGGK